MSQEATGNGKIERLPWELREQVCRKLRDGVPTKKVCAWLNSLPEVLSIMDEFFGEQPINDQNITNFRQGGYQRWLTRQGKIERTRELANYSIEVARASGGQLADGAAQLIAGNILEVLEQLDGIRNRTNGADGTDVLATAEAIDGLALSVSRLRKGDQNAEALRQRERQLAQADENLKLEKQKFQRTTCELFLKWRDDRRATEIADGPGTSDDKVNALGQAMFGDLWQ